MYAQPADAIETVLAARAGDPRAVDELVRSYLPLVYNIAGRALDGHPDVDDVVQETMAKAISGLAGLRTPESFRSWLVAITMNQVREWRRTRAGSVTFLDEVFGMADPAADFTGLTITQLGLSGQRKETAEATRWLDLDDQEVLSLWWLEVAGELSRAELAAGLGLTEQHAAVRVQRMKRRLESSRAVVRALAASCGGLRAATAEWDGKPGPLWRKRISRHVQDCPYCSTLHADLVPADRLLAGLALVALPAGFALASLLKTQAVATGAAGAAGAAGSVAIKPIAAAAVGAALVAGGSLAVYTFQPDPPPRQAAVPVVVSSPASARPSPTKASPTRTRTPRPRLYGTIVDAVDQAPPKNARPDPLPERRDGTIKITGKHDYSRFGGAPQINHRGDYVTLTGRGYFQVRWGVLYRNRAGDFPPATWTGLKGKLFHVASGGGRRMDDESSPGVTWMGPVKLPRGHQQMWQNEFYYLDGSVTFHNNEGTTDVDLNVSPKTWRDVWADLTARPDPAKGIIRYGLTRDTGNDRAPVPQYLTRANPANPAEVPQRSRVAAR
ncbi:RNA polymerase sigma factor [Nonomuraea basaltis]|uniref:RNA polymerase sigma factor n=1 Tax=Nonomuraea basaltis TaxID=2495887 RepID=UPI00110C6671|nr:sigma-70 family RNA polymerase sigma factor [Nonomuraea basaltis]TMR99831.1 sigma-70 family RNA polymerase sigma factor [Nonomuraea basaltis]